MINQRLSVNVRGVQWNLYSADWTGADGKFSFYFYAVSHDHAQMVLQEIKETAVFSGQVVGAMDADDWRDHG